MSASEEDIYQWLEKGSQPEVVKTDGASEAEIESYLDKQPKTKIPQGEPIPADEEWYKPAIDVATGFNDQVLDFVDLLIIPEEAANWAFDKMGVDYRIPGLREIGTDIGVATRPGEEPTTGSYKAGEYTAMGLEFLFPFLKGGQAVATIANPSVLKGVSQTIAKPFTAVPKVALGTEVAGGVASGYGAFYGGEEWGAVGEQVGGLIGAAPALGIGAIRSSSDYIVRSFFPFTEAGGKAKAASVIKQLRESPNFVNEIKKQEALSLTETKHTPARLSKEPYLIALEKALIHDDPELAHTLRNIDAENNALAKVALEELGGQGAIEEAIKSLGTKYAKLKVRLDLKVDSALKKSQQALSKINPLNQRKVVNIEVKKQIDTALKAARESENAIWREVDKTAIAPTQETKKSFLNVLQARELEDDPTDIPGYLYTFLGRMKNNVLQGGKYTETRHVGGMQQLRSRLLQTIRAEKAGETPNWNKVRVLEDVEEAILKDMGNSNAAKGLEDAIGFSRELNKKFKGDIMSVILRNNKTGGSLAPELTLDSLGSGPKGAYYIKRILKASPDSKDNIEDVLKMDILQQKIVKEGTMNIPKAKDYMNKNEQIMEMFPNLKDDMDNAIAFAEAHKYFEGSLKVRLKKAEQALGFSLSDKTNPGQFLPKILKSKDPEKTMLRVLRQVNNKGKAGIKNDVIDLILNKSKTSELGADETFMLSGKKALGFWNENKSVLSKALNKEETKRLERILNDLRLGDDPKHIPEDVAKAALVPSKTILGYVIEVAAARMGAMLGKGTSGASLKTASQASNTAKRIMGNLDMGTAQKLLKSAVQDRDLYVSLAEDVTKLPENKQALNIIQSWMLAHAVSSLEEQ